MRLSRRPTTSLFSVLFFICEGSANIIVRAHESKELSCIGHGVAAWNALKESFDGDTKGARRACREKILSKSIKLVGDPVDFIATMDDLRLRLEVMGKILDNTYADVLLNSFPKVFKFIKNAS